MLKYMRLANLFDIFLNPGFKMTTSFANITRTTASIFIIFQIYQKKNLCVYFLITCQLLKRYKTLFGRRLFSISLFYHLCFVFHYVFTFYHGPPRFMIN